MIPFRLGTTSYIIPDDILPNVRYLAGKVQDVELVLFEVDHDLSNLPSPDVIKELAGLAKENDLTYTVHLPLDLRLGAGGEETHLSLVKARKVIELTRPLTPWAFVMHLDANDSGDRLAWTRQATRSLELVAEWAGGPERLAVENLYGHPLDLLRLVLDQVSVCHCVDVGHLWLDDHDPLPILRRALPRTKVIHLHGVGSRDHQSLALIPEEQLLMVLVCLLQERYTGVVTLEVFNKQDLETSLQTLFHTLRNIWENGLS